MIATEYLVIVLALMVLFVIYYTLGRESRQQRQIRSIASAVEELRRELYETRRALDKCTEMPAMLPQGMDEAEMSEELERGLQRIAGPVSVSLRDMEAELAAHKESIEHRLISIEERMRNLTLPSSVSGMDDDKIISLYQQGASIAAIAKELRLSQPEVEFVLKINQIK